MSQFYNTKNKRLKDSNERWKMKPWRIVYMVAIIASISLTIIFYYQLQLKGKESMQNQKLSQLYNQALTELNGKLETSLKENEYLNMRIASLEKDNSIHKGQLQALKEERKELLTQIAHLAKEKLVLEKKFQSLEELKKAVNIVKLITRTRKKQETHQRRLAKIAMLQRLDEIALQQGNQGYVVKDGTSTFASKIKIGVELEPISKFYLRD